MALMSLLVEACSSQDEKDRVKEAITESRSYDIAIRAVHIISDVWDCHLYDDFEQAVHRRARKEKLLPVTIEVADDDGDTINEKLVTIMWEKFGLREHFRQTGHHRRQIKFVWDRFKAIFKSQRDILNHRDLDLLEMVDFLVKHHDLNKYALDQAFRYTLKFVRDIHHHHHVERTINKHRKSEPHHSQFWRSGGLLSNWVENMSFVSTTTKKWLRKQLQPAQSNIPQCFILEMFFDQVVRHHEKTNPDLPIESMNNDHRLFHFNYRYPHGPAERPFRTLVHKVKKIPLTLNYTKQTDSVCKPLELDGYSLLPSPGIYTILPQDSVEVDMGLSITIPTGVFGTITSCSDKSMLVIASPLRSSCKVSLAVKLLNYGNNTIEVQKGETLAQLTFQRCESIKFIETNDDDDDDDELNLVTYLAPKRNLTEADFEDDSTSDHTTSHLF